MIRAALLATAFALAACATTSTAPPPAISSRPAVPRLAPVPPEARDADQQRMMQGKGNANIYTTLARHPQLADAWTPFSNYLFNASTAPRRSREMVILRMAWLCQAPYDWSQHSAIALRNGLTEAEVIKVAEGPTAEGWSDLDRLVLTMVHEVRYDGAPSAKTWQALKSALGAQAATEVVMTAAQYEMASMILNSAGVQLDANLKYRLPTNLPMPLPATRPAHANGGPGAAEVLAAYPTLSQGLASLDRGVEQTSLLPRDRAILTLRTSYLLHADGEWTRPGAMAAAAGLSKAGIARIANGVSAKGWSASDRALIQAADDLRREAFITDATWSALSARYGQRALLEILYTVGDVTLNVATSGGLAAQAH